MGDEEVDSSISRDVSLKRCCFKTGLVCINDVLPDQVLVEILCCLPCGSAVACKLVCKCWLSLISTPGFISRFISRQISSKGYCQQQQQLKHRVRGRYLFLTPQVPNSDIYFRFLPDPRRSTVSSSSYKSRVRIWASSDDLFFCSPSRASAAALFISSPFTKEWVELPHPPSSHHCNHRIYGFTHKPYFSVEDRSARRVLVNSSCRFRVARMLLLLPVSRMERHRHYVAGGSEFEVDIFSSETWQWATSKMQLSSRTSLPRSAISRNGFLYWLCYSGDVIVHDPYNNKVCYVVESPSPGSTWRSSLYLSVSQGSVLGFSFFCRNGFTVWELEDIDPHRQQPKWRLERSAVALNEYMVNSSEMVEWAEWGSPKGLCVFAVHPNDRNIFYLLSFSRGIATINLKTREFKPVFGPPQIRGTRLRYISMAVIKKPCWPTPISALLNQPALPPADSDGQ